MKRWVRSYGVTGGFLLLGVVWLVMAVTGGGIRQTLFCVAYVTLAVLHFFRAPDRARERSRQRLEAKYASSQSIVAQEDNPPRWFSPDNPPGWYRSPGTDEPAYWSELGWRTRTSQNPVSSRD